MKSRAQGQILTCFTALMLLGLAACTPTSQEPDSEPDPRSNNNTMEQDTPDQDAGSTPEEDMGRADLDEPQNTTPTYYGTVKPIFDKHCTSCHRAGDIAPFTLEDDGSEESYAEIKSLAPAIRYSVQARSMPPWPLSQECGEFRDARVLTQEQIDQISAWADGGALRGDPSEEAAPIEPEDSGEELPDPGEPDFVADIGVDYDPQPQEGQYDDYRCFIIDAPFDGETRYVNSYDVHPGNRNIVHHVILYGVGADKIDRLRRKDENDPRPGYECFGGPGSWDATVIAGWVPGQKQLIFPEGVGLRLYETRRMVVQIHYNTANANEEPDRTKIDLHFTKEPAHTPLAALPLLNNDFVLPPGERDLSVDATFEIPLNVRVWGALPHMHQLGTSISVSVTDKAGQESCMLDIPKWDFNWQGFYLLKKPKTFRQGSTVKLNCVFDNSAENQALGQDPREVRWGDGTFDEMCLSYFIVEDKGNLLENL